MLEELPSSSSGVSRTEYQILRLIDRGESQSRNLFTESQKLEEAAFMGDWSFYGQLSRLVNSPEPLIHVTKGEGFDCDKKLVEPQVFLEGKLELSTFGKAVLSGEEDYASKNDVDFWWGGTHLNTDNL